MALCGGGSLPAGAMHQGRQTAWAVLQDQLQVTVLVEQVWRLVVVVPWADFAVFAPEKRQAQGVVGGKANSGLTCACGWQRSACGCATDADLLYIAKAAGMQAQENTNLKDLSYVTVPAPASQPSQPTHHCSALTQPDLNCPLLPLPNSLRRTSPRSPLSAMYTPRMPNSGPTMGAGNRPAD